MKLKASCEEMQEALMILKGKWISTLINIKQYIWEKLLSFTYTEIGSELLITEKEIFKLWETGFMKVAAQFSVASPKEYSKNRKLTENVPNVFKSTSSTQRTVTQTKTQMSPQKRWMKHVIEVYKTITSREKVLTKESNSCSISLPLQEGEGNNNKKIRQV